jgi:hypothetical protein
MKHWLNSIFNPNIPDPRVIDVEYLYNYKVFSLYDIEYELGEGYTTYSGEKLYPIIKTKNKNENVNRSHWMEYVKTFTEETLAGYVVLEGKYQTMKSSFPEQVYIDYNIMLLKELINKIDNMDRRLQIATSLQYIPDEAQTKSVRSLLAKDEPPPAPKRASQAQTRPQPPRQRVTQVQSRPNRRVNNNGYESWN